MTRGVRENGLRPAADALFRSAARAYCPKVIGVVLSGVLDDGAVGLGIIKSLGGIAIVQDPGEAAFPGMPQSAIDHVDVDYVLPVAEIPRTLASLTAPAATAAESATLLPAIEAELELSDRFAEGVFTEDRTGRPSPFTCPSCHGVLWETSQGGMPWFRCRTGHAYAEESLLANQNRALEDTLWIAVRALEEQEEICRRLAERSQYGGRSRSALHFEELAAAARARAKHIREILL